MPHVAARVAPGPVMTAAAMLLLSAVSVYAKADPDNPNGTHDGRFDNPGHHYGQLKHQSPPPSPLPTTAPAPPPVAPLLSNALHPANQSSPGSGPQLSARIPRLRLTLPVLPPEQFRLANRRPADDGLWWLLLLILPLLLAIWLLVVSRLAAAGVRRLRASKPTSPMAPATT